MRGSKIMLLILILVAPIFASAADQYAWINKIFEPSYCALVDSSGSEVRKVSYDLCSTEGLIHKWVWVVAGYSCALTSKTNESFYVLVHNRDCGVPDNSYYKWMKSGLDDNDFKCALRIKGNDTFYVYVKPSFCRVMGNGQTAPAR